MKLTSAAATLLRHLSASWPSGRPVFSGSDEVEIDPSSPFADEITALCGKIPCSLPYFLPSGDVVAWVTTAPDAECLHAAIEDLRAWIIPSFGWDDPRRPIVSPGTVDSGTVGQTLSELSPGGYFRWRTRRGDVAFVVSKLAMLRESYGARPTHTAERIPSLMEMRQQFHTASAAGNRDAAEAAIDTIDRYQLDTASNTAFMRILLAETFGDVDFIVSGEQARRAFALQLPRRVRTAILNAFHRVHFKPHEDIGEFHAAAVAYSAALESEIGGLVATASVSDSNGIARLLAYRAVLLADSRLAAVVHDAMPNDPVTVLLHALVVPPPSPSPEPSLEQRFYQARVRNDWAEVQRLGVELLKDSDEPIAILKRSLEFEPNSQLVQLLADRIGAAEPTRKTTIAEHSASIAAADASGPSWLKWLVYLRACRWAAAVQLLEERHTNVAELTDGEVGEMSFALEELYTGQDLNVGSRLERSLRSGLPVMIQEFSEDTGFPRARYGELYEQMLFMWGHVRYGSLLLVDGQLLLSLADAVIRAKPGSANPAVEQLLRWWEAKPVRAMISFAFEAIDLLLDVTNGRTTASTLWFAVADVARQNVSVLSATERSLLRYLARRLEIEDAVVVGYVPEESVAEESDPLKSAGLRRIAIVHSWAPDAARRATELLRLRTSADIVEIQAEERTAKVKAAGNNDVLLFLHRRSAHQLFYGLDTVAREKIVYVPGVTASSIVFALEQWAQKYSGA
jgi:hypothetical protein